jgi:hypothetical protein
MYVELLQGNETKWLSCNDIYPLHRHDVEATILCDSPYDLLSSREVSAIQYVSSSLPLAATIH